MKDKAEKNLVTDGEDELQIWYVALHRRLEQCENSREDKANNNCDGARKEESSGGGEKTKSKVRGN